MRSNSLFIARVIVYLFTACMLLVMIFADPFEYLCNGDNIVCPGCGIKTGLYRLLHFDIDGAIQSNIASLWIAAIGMLATIDVVLGCIKNASKTVFLKHKR